MDVAEALSYGRRASRGVNRLRADMLSLDESQNPVYRSGEVAPPVLFRIQAFASEVGKLVHAGAPFVLRWSSRLSQDRLLPYGAGRDKSEPSSTRRASSEACWMCMAMPYPCIGACFERTLRTRRSSELWREAGFRSRHILRRLRGSSLSIRVPANYRSVNRYVTHVT